MIRNAALFGIGRIIYAACQWMVMIYLARYYSTEKLGMYTYALALVAPVVMFSQMNMRMYLITDWKDKYSYTDYIVTRLVMVMVALIVIFLVSIISAEEEALLVVLLVAVFKSIESVADILCAILQKNNRIDLVARSNILRGLSLLLSIIIVTYSGYTFLESLVLVAVSWLVIMIFNDYFNVARDLKKSVKTGLLTVKAITKKCFPLGIVMSIMALNFALPVYFIEYYHGVETVGFYSAIAYFLALGKLFTDSFIQTSSSNVAKLYQEGNNLKLKILLGKLLGINAIIGLSAIFIVYIFGSEILTMIYGEAFSQYYSTFLVIMVAALFNYMAQVFGLLLTIKRRFYRMVAVHLFQTSVILFVSVILVSANGVLGGAYALLAGFISIMFANIFLLYIDNDFDRIIMSR